MATNERKRQQKLMKKRQKAKNKKKRSVRNVSANTDKAIIRRARHYPLHECLINDNWQEEGIASIIVARRQSETKIVFGVYLVDLYCLGVKNTFCNANVPLSKYRDDFRARYFDANDARACPVDLAHQIIYGAMKYAASLDLHPHSDFQLSRHILDLEEDVPPNEALEFGKDGKPLFVSGPDDSVDRILKHLEKQLGKDGFHFICAVQMP